MTDLHTLSFGELDLEVRDLGTHRHVAGIVVPFDQTSLPVEINGKPALEVFKRGALQQSINRRGDSIPLTWYHPEPDRPYADKKIIGVSLREDWQETQFGQRAGFKLLRTSQAAEALEAIDAGVVRAFSVGFMPVKGKTSQERNADGFPIYVRHEVNLDHVALVPSGAFTGAGVEEVRAFLLQRMNEEEAIRRRRLELLKLAS